MGKRVHCGLGVEDRRNQRVGGFWFIEFGVVKGKLSFVEFEIVEIMVMGRKKGKFNG